MRLESACRNTRNHRHHCTQRQTDSSLRAFQLLHFSEEHLGHRAFGWSLSTFKHFPAAQHCSYRSTCCSLRAVAPILLTFTFSFTLLDHFSNTSSLFSTLTPNFLTNFFFQMFFAHFCHFSFFLPLLAHFLPIFEYF